MFTLPFFPPSLYLSFSLQPPENNETYASEFHINNESYAKECV